MSITSQELIQIILTLKKEYGNNVDTILENIFKHNISWNEHSEINFFDNSEKSAFNSNHLEIFSEKIILPIGTSSIKMSKDKKNVIFKDAFSEKTLIPYNKDVFVKILKCPLDEFLKHI